MENEYSEPNAPEYRVFKDGNSWFAVDHNFVDLQQSPAGYGETPLDALSQLLSPVDPAETCLWSQDYAGSDMFSTSCGNAFRLDNGVPSENEMEFCCFCGRALEEDLPTADD
jgi:hypothetical protein